MPSTSTRRSRGRSPRRPTPPARATSTSPTRTAGSSRAFVDDGARRDARLDAAVDGAAARAGDRGRRRPSSASRPTRARRSSRASTATGSRAPASATSTWSGWTASWAAGSRGRSSPTRPRAGRARRWASRTSTRLWDAFAHALRLDEPDPAAAWQQRLDELQARARELTERAFTALRYRGPGTDLEVGLIEGARWLAGRERTVHGQVHAPNLPDRGGLHQPAPPARRGHGPQHDAARPARHDRRGPRAARRGRRDRRGARDPRRGRPARRARHRRRRAPLRRGRAGGRLLARRARPASPSTTRSSTRTPRPTSPGARAIPWALDHVPADQHAGRRASTSPPPTRTSWSARRRSRSTGSSPGVRAVALLRDGSGSCRRSSAAALADAAATRLRTRTGAPCARRHPRYAAGSIGDDHVRTLVGVPRRGEVVRVEHSGHRREAERRCAPLAGRGGVVSERAVLPDGACAVTESAGRLRATEADRPRRPSRPVAAMPTASSGRSCLGTRPQATALSGIPTARRAPRPRARSPPAPRARRGAAGRIGALTSGRCPASPTAAGTPPCGAGATARRGPSARPPRQPRAARRRAGWRGGCRGRRRRATSGRPRVNIRKMCALHSPMPLTATSSAMTSSSESCSRRSSSSSPASTCSASERR